MSYRSPVPFDRLCGSGGGDDGGDVGEVAGDDGEDAGGFVVVVVGVAGVV